MTSSFPPYLSHNLVSFVVNRHYNSFSFSFTTSYYHSITNANWIPSTWTSVKHLTVSPHNNLLIKLWSRDINGNLWLWFKAYLTSRKQCVSINHHPTNFLPVLFEVPQSSILGPLLFLIYISDLPSTVSFSKLLSFADVTRCLKCIQNPDDCTNLQLHLSSRQNWSNHNLLLFNVLKFVQISLHSNHKDLGIIIFSDLSWNNHYNYISSRAYKPLGLLR